MSFPHDLPYHPHNPNDPAVALDLARHAERLEIDQSDLTWALRIVEARGQTWHHQVRLMYV